MSSGRRGRCRGGGRGRCRGGLGRGGDGCPVLCCAVLVAKSIYLSICQSVPVPVQLSH